MPFIRRLRKSSALLVALVATSFLQACASVDTPTMHSPDVSFEKDRAAILAMAGTFKVSFDFTETVAFAPGYELKPKKLSGGYEAVRVIEDRGDFISLQHILVVGGEEKFPVKHWRQDWRYEPAQALIFVGGNAWEQQDVPAQDRAGAWSQTVYQVDDAPRYAAVARWSHENGASEWTPPSEWRPLPRRDATTRDDYHAIDAVNRHAITPAGWVHEQDNSKLALLEDGPSLIVREIGVNSYVRVKDVDFSAADEYWGKTQDYWAGVRATWTEMETANDAFGLTIQGEPEALYFPVLALADKVAAGEMSTEDAVADARDVIDSFTTTDIGDLQGRLTATAGSD